MFDSTDGNQNAWCTTKSYNGPKSQISTFYDYPFSRNARYIHTYIRTHIYIHTYRRHEKEGQIGLRGDQNESFTKYFSFRVSRDPNAFLFYVLES